MRGGVEVLDHGGDTVFRIARHFLDRVVIRLGAFVFLLRFLEGQTRRGSFAIQHLLAQIGLLGAIEIGLDAAGVAAGAGSLQAGCDDRAFQVRDARLDAVDFSRGGFALALQALVANARQQLALIHFLAHIHQERLHGTADLNGNRYHMLGLDLPRQNDFGCGAGGRAGFPLRAAGFFGRRAAKQGQRAGGHSQ